MSSATDYRCSDLRKLLWCDILFIGGDVIYSRRLLIHSVANMRELGGYTTNDGMMTQWRRFVRSDVPINLSADDIDFIYDYGVRTVIDLREKIEIEETPSAFAKINSDKILYRNISFTDDHTYFWDINYCPLNHIVPVMKGEHRVCEIMTELANAPAGGIIFHCAAGKDRTGVIAVLLLLIANVPVEDILTDWQVTYTYIEKNIKPRLDGRKRNIALCRTEPEWIIPFIDFVLEYGSVTNYLSEQGMKMSDIKLLKERLIK